MKNLFLFITFFLMVNIAYGQGDAPTSIFRQGDGLKNKGTKIYVPNNQATKLTNGTLVETGNKNLLENASFEHSTFSTAWTSTGGGFSNTGFAKDGLKGAAVNVTATAVNLYQSSTLNQAAFSDGLNGFISAFVKTDLTNLYLCARQAGVLKATSNGTEITNCKKIASDNKVAPYELPIILGATSNGVALVTLDATTAASQVATGTVEADDFKLAAGDVRQSGASCNSIECETEFSAKVSSTDVVSDENYDWISGNCTNATTGRGTCTYPVGLFSQTPNCSFTGNNGEIVYIVTGQSATSITYETRNSAGTTVNYGVTISCQRSGTDFTNAKRLGNNTTYSSTNADTDWASCGHTTSDFTGFGTVSAIETQCKRQGSDLLMRGNFTSGVSTAVEARLNLKLNGAALTSASTSKIASLQKNGSYARATGTVNKGGFVLIEPSVSYFTFGDPGTFSNSTLNSVLKTNGSTVASTGIILALSEIRIPIAGWDNSNQIIGSFKEVMTVPGVSRPKTCYYAFGGASATLASPTECTTGTCVEVYDSCGTGTPPAQGSVARYDGTTWASGTWKANSYVSCFCSSYDTGTTSLRHCAPFFLTGSIPWYTNASGGLSFSNYSVDATGTQQTTYVQITCKGEAP